MQKKKYKGKYVTVTEEVSYGHICERVQLLPGVYVLPIRAGKVLLMKEYRGSEKGVRWKLVSGWIDKEKISPLKHAQEELAEELGMGASHWEEIYRSFEPNATINLNTIYFVCTDVYGLKERVHNPDNRSEVLDYRWFGYEDIINHVKKKEIWPDQSSMLALLHLHNISPV